TGVERSRQRARGGHGRVQQFPLQRRDACTTRTSKNLATTSNLAPHHPPKLPRIVPGTATQAQAGRKHGVRIMTSATLIHTLLLSAALLTASAHAAPSTIAIAVEDGTPVAQFTVGDSDCILKDDQIQCTPTSR